VSVTVQRIDPAELRTGTTRDRCHACASESSQQPSPPEFRLSADPEERYRDGSTMQLCPAHAIRMWNALGAMLMMHDPPLLRAVGSGPQRGVTASSAGKRLL
jgi:hypothetical protein